MWTDTPAAASAPASSVTGRPHACVSSIAARRAPEAGGLWRLCGGDLVALDRRDDPAAAHALERVDDRDDRHDRPLHPGGRGHDRLDQLVGDAGPRRVVDEDERLVIVARRR